MANNPLVSVVVVTYNSAPFVRETLESIKAQSYAPLELIISDDHSTDDTVAVCREWLANHASHFAAARLITVEKNTGIPANCNRGINAARGAWIKPIAGDDALEAQAIERYVQEVQAAPEIQFMYANVKVYLDSFAEENALPVQDISQLEFNRAETIRERQIEILVQENTVWAATFFFSKNIFDKVGGFDEKYPFFDDKPFLMRILNSGYKIHFLNIISAKYRKSRRSVQLSDKLLSGHIRDVLTYDITELRNLLTKNHYIKSKSHLEAKRLVAALFSNRKNAFTLSAFFALYYALYAFRNIIFLAKK